MNLIYGVWVYTGLNWLRIGMCGDLVFIWGSIKRWKFLD